MSVIQLSWISKTSHLSIYFFLVSFFLYFLFSFLLLPALFSFFFQTRFFSFLTKFVVFLFLGRLQPDHKRADPWDESFSVEYSNQLVQGNFKMSGNSSVGKKSTQRSLFFLQRMAVILCHGAIKASSPPSYCSFLSVGNGDCSDLEPSDGSNGLW